eukprot:scaffold32406_cov186-Amphora_coffeaeformis.AAC.1
MMMQGHCRVPERVHIKKGMRGVVLFFGSRSSTPYTISSSKNFQSVVPYLILLGFRVCCCCCCFVRGTSGRRGSSCHVVLYTTRYTYQSRAQRGT